MTDLSLKIGQLLRETRVEKKLTQEKLSLQCGIDRSYMGRIERGEVNITVEKLYVGEIEKNTSVETQKEYKQKYRKIQSPFYNKNAADLVNNDFFQIVKNNDISSKFKRFKISGF